jgi:YaiO family outer membrane protein
MCKRVSQITRVLFFLIVIVAFFPDKPIFAEEKINYDHGLMKVRSYTDIKDFQKAEDLLREMLSFYPENSELLNMLARILYWQKKYDESIAVYQRLLAVKPSAEVQQEMNKVFAGKGLYDARELQDSGNFKAAEEKLRYLYDLGQAKYEAGYRLGMLYIKQREYKEALQIFSELKTLYPDDKGFEELYLESLILAGEIKKANKELYALTDERRSELYSKRDDLFYRVRRNYLMISGSAVDYTQGIEDEKQYTVRLSQRIAEQTLVFSYSNIDRFGKTDNEVGLDIYSKLGEKTRRWGYISLTTAPEADFLARWTAGGYVYQGYKYIDFSLGYVHMAFRDAPVDRVVPGIIAYLPYGFSVNEQYFISLNNGTTALLSKLHFEPNHKFNGFYSYSFGESSEKISTFKDTEKISTYSHAAGVEYRFREYLSIGAEYRFNSRENSYKQKGITLSAKYWW